jgi:Flp pilus assembly protein TadG
MPRLRAPLSSPPQRRRRNGQSIVEFAIVFPVLLLLLAGVSDLGRIYTSAVAVESAAREAADFGSFHAVNWQTTPVDNRSVIVQQMERRACTAAAGSHLDGYSEPAGTISHATCTNPSFSYTLEPDNPSCSDPATDPPCIVHVRMDYDFNLFLGIPPMPSTIHLSRDSRFQMADLTPP